MNGLVVDLRGVTIETGMIWGGVGVYGKGGVWAGA